MWQDEPALALVARNTCPVTDQWFFCDDITQVKKTFNYKLNETGRKRSSKQVRLAGEYEFYRKRLTDPVVPSCSVDMCVANWGIIELYCTELGSDAGII
jgi:hypothetical protein